MLKAYVIDSIGGTPENQNTRCYIRRNIAPISINLDKTRKRSIIDIISVGIVTISLERVAGAVVVITKDEAHPPFSNCGVAR